MSDELNEVQEPSILEVAEPQTAVDQDVELDIEELKARAAKADEFKGFADRVAKENKELKKKLDPPKSLQTNESSPTDERFERLELKTEGYKSDEVDFLMQNGGRKALENPIVMAGIEGIRAKAKSQDATPSGTGKSTVYKKYTEADLKRMPAEELEKIVPQ